MKTLHMISWALLVIGGLNWLLTAFNVGLETWVSASWWQSLMFVVYILVGLSAIYEIFTHRQNCKMCAAKESGAMNPSPMS